MFSLSNKVALVIGGKGLIGAEVSIALAGQGAKVFVASRSQEIDKELESKFNKNKVNVISLDASVEAEVSSAVKDIISNHGHIDILVNCSAWRPSKEYMNDTPETWEESIKVNSSAMFFPSRIIGKEMAKKGSGSIINISSIYGIVSPPMSLYDNCDFQTEPDYPFLKAGSIGLTKYLSSYFAESNVRVNAIAPGGVANNQPTGFTDRYKYHVPMKRMASPADIVGAVFFYASDEYSYVTGTVLPVDGGWTAV